uniref:Uncharacterized protein n=1 Tax=Davidia involucrata TaxID=16924 RepID=A0A5B7BRA2_DAVIN
MSNVRAKSSPALLPSSTATEQDDGSSSLEGVAANVKLLLKLIQDHNEACCKEKNDSRRMLRVAGMMTILDNVRTRIQKCQSFGLKREAELRRCNTDVRHSHVPRDKRPNEVVTDEKEKLRRELNASLAARKSLEIMCCSLGKEKEIMAAELARKVHESSGMEELISDLKAQNGTLLEKVQECAAEHKEKKCSSGGEAQANAALQERNKVLSEQVLRSLDGYRSAKRKLKEAQEDNAAMRATMEEMRVEVGASLERIHGFKQGSEQQIDIEEEISQLEHVFECFEIKVSKHGQKKGECLKPKGEISASQPSVLA